VQLLARSQVTITDLVADRSLYQFGMPERFAEVTFRATNLQHKKAVLKELSAKGFQIREVSG
jgi:hypothetical protein